MTYEDILQAARKRPLHATVTQRRIRVAEHVPSLPGKRLNQTAVGWKVREKEAGQGRRGIVP